MLDLPLDLFTTVCQQLDLQDLVRVAETCKRFRYGDGGLDTAELPTKSPVVTVLLEHAFPRGGLIPSTRPIGCSESWVTYLARRARQRRCRESPPIAAGDNHSMFVLATAQLLECGGRTSADMGCYAGVRRYSKPTPVAAMSGIRVRSIAMGRAHTITLGWDGRVHSWGENEYGQLGQGDRLTKLAPALIDGLDGVCFVAAADSFSLAVTQSGALSFWGSANFLKQPKEDSVAPSDNSEDSDDFDSFDEALVSLLPVTVEGFEGVRIRPVCCDDSAASAIGEDGELFSWGEGMDWRLGHGDRQDQPSPKRVEALRGGWVSSVACGHEHVLALSEDGLVYAWDKNEKRATLGNPHVKREPLRKPVEALRGVRVGSVATAYDSNFAVADTGELCAWGVGSGSFASLGNGEQTDCPIPKPIEALRGVKLDAVVGTSGHRLVWADDGSVYSWGQHAAAESGALGLGFSVWHVPGCDDVMTFSSRSSCKHRRFFLVEFLLRCCLWSIGMCGCGWIYVLIVCAGPWRERRACESGGGGRRGRAC
jgi:alpha-tubulin suppressor-like RCC1 family protein